MTEQPVSAHPMTRRALFVRTTPRLGKGVRMVPARPAGWVVLVVGLAVVLGLSVPTAIAAASRTTPFLGMPLWALGFAVLMGGFLWAMWRVSAPRDAAEPDEESKR